MLKSKSCNVMRSYFPSVSCRKSAIHSLAVRTRSPGRLINVVILFSACQIYCNWETINSRRPCSLLQSPPTLLQLVMDAVDKILPVLPGDLTVIFDSLEMIEFDLHQWLSNQTNHLSLGSEGGGEMNGCAGHADLFELESVNLSPRGSCFSLLSLIGQPECFLNTKSG